MQERVQEIIILTRQAWASAPPQRRSDWLWPTPAPTHGPTRAVRGAANGPIEQPAIAH
jgi:hypothetical protein